MSTCVSLYICTSIYACLYSLHHFINEYGILTFIFPGDKPKSHYQRGPRKEPQHTLMSYHIDRRWGLACLWSVRCRCWVWFPPRWWPSLAWSPRGNWWYTCKIMFYVISIISHFYSFFVVIFALFWNKTTMQLFHKSVH